jgi:divinyl chlorophyllide a 8-vinyl-reductase
LASRSGIKKDAYAIDYQATKNCLDAGVANKARHFVLLSAFCVKNPWLQFQQAKLKFEADLQAQKTMTYSIVRPTAFFKSVSGQLEVVQNGAPFVMFGDGEVTRCNPIAEADLATYLVDCISDKSRENKIINLGGPDQPLTMKRQGEVRILLVPRAQNASGEVSFYGLEQAQCSIVLMPCHGFVFVDVHHRCSLKRWARRKTFSMHRCGSLM